MQSRPSELRRNSWVSSVVVILAAAAMLLARGAEEHAFTGGTCEREKNGVCTIAVGEHRIERRACLRGGVLGVRTDVEVEARSVVEVRVGGAFALHDRLEHRHGHLADVQRAAGAAHAQPIFGFEPENTVAATGCGRWLRWRGVAAAVAVPEHQGAAGRLDDVVRGEVRRERQRGDGERPRVHAELRRLQR